MTDHDVKSGGQATPRRYLGNHVLPGRASPSDTSIHIHSILKPETGMSVFSSYFSLTAALSPSVTVILGIKCGSSYPLSITKHPLGSSNNDVTLQKKFRNKKSLFARLVIKTNVRWCRSDM